MIKCIHTGDLHLGSQFRNASFDGIYSKQRRLEMWETFERIVDRAIENNIDFLFISGDLYEEKYFTIGDIKRVRDKLGEAKDTNVLISTGNHDPIGENSLYNKIDWPENVHIFHPEGISSIRYEEHNTVIWGYSWDKKEEKKDLLSEIKIDEKENINILLIHGDLLNKDSVYLPMDKQLLESKGFDYIALGHIHKPQFITDRICYCGSPEPLDFGETGIHGIIEGTIDNKNLSMSLLPFSKRSFIIKEIYTTELMTYNAILDKIKKVDKLSMRKENLYRVALKGLRDRDIDLNIEDLKEVLSDDFYYLELIDETVPDYDLEKLKVENENNIIGLFIEEMSKKDLNDDIIKEALYTGLGILLKEKVIK